MADIWILCKKENNVLTAVGADTTEPFVKDLARDGDYLAIPITLGKLYANIIDEGMVGAVNFSNISLYTKVQQAKSSIQTINADIAALNARVTALEST